MGLFDEQVKQVSELIGAWRSEGRLREFASGERPPWPRANSLVLEEDTALELGNPGVASLSMLAWGDPELVSDGRISLVGPDISEAVEPSIPFAQVLMVGGAFVNEYDSYRDLRDAVYDTHVEGFSVRTMPSRQILWCRVGREAFGGGLSLADLGSALIEGVKEVETVEAAEVLFVTSERADVQKLAGAASGASKVVDAMMKMYQENNFDCESCEYQDVCDSVMELKSIRDRLAKGV